MIVLFGESEFDTPFTPYLDDEAPLSARPRAFSDGTFPGALLLGVDGTGSVVSGSTYVFVLFSKFRRFSSRSVLWN